MSVLLVHMVSGRDLRGAEQQVYLQMSYLKNQNISQIGIFSTNAKIIQKVKNIGIETLSGNLNFNFLFALRVRKKILSMPHKNIILHANCSKSLSLAILIKLLTKSKIVMSRRNTFKIKSKWKYAFVDKIITCSKAVETVVRKSLPKKSITIEVIYDSIFGERIDYKEFTPKAKPFILIGCALSPEKGIDDLIDKWHYFKSQYNNDCELLIAGSGELKPSLENKIKLNELNSTKLLGWVDDIEKLILKSEVCLLNSHSEGLGSFLCLASSLGKPLMGPGIGGIPEVVINNYNGFIYKSKEEFAEKLNAILTNQNLKKKFSQNSKVVFDQRFNSINNFKKYKKIYFDLFNSN